MSDTVTVIQADRDLLKSLMALVGNDDVLCNRIDLGLAYVGEVEEIARHRIAHEPKWLPIDDAPCLPILVACPAKDGEARKTAAAFLDATGVWRVYRSKGGMEPVPFIPTHYQPLPTPPEQTP